MRNENPKLISRDQALSEGLLRYYTGKPCPHGHRCERYVSTWQCVQCNLEANRRNQKGAKSYQPIEPDVARNACPCDSCAMMHACRRSGATCAAFSAYANGGSWRHKKRAPTRAGVAHGG